MALWAADPGPSDHKWWIVLVAGGWRLAAGGSATLIAASWLEDESGTGREVLE